MSTPLANSGNSTTRKLELGSGLWLADTGIVQHAVLLELALDDDPLAVYPRMWLGVMLWLGREYDSAIEQHRMVLELSPNYILGLAALGMVCREAGMFDEAIAAHRRAAELSGNAPLFLGWLRLALAQSGDTAAARGLLDRPPKDALHRLRATDQPGVDPNRARRDRPRRRPRVRPMPMAPKRPSAGNRSDR